MSSLRTPDIASRPPLNSERVPFFSKFAIPQLAVVTAEAVLITQALQKELAR